MKSMTGFGRASATLPDGTEATVLVRGVNQNGEIAGVKNLWINQVLPG